MVMIRPEVEEAHVRVRARGGFRVRPGAEASLGFSLISESAKL